MNTLNVLLSGSLLLFGLWPSASAGEDQADSTIVQYGEMHQAIGQGQDEGRVRLGELTEKPNFYAVAALEGLEGEVTIHDGQITVTTVDESGRLRPATGQLADKKATLLVGAYVPAWKEIEVANDVSADDFDNYIMDTAKAAGCQTDKPFMFTVAGQLTDVQLHVINGACPIRARMKKKELPSSQRPYEVEMPVVEGTIVGISATDAVGKLTHPATTTHSHLLFRDPNAATTVTGHVEAVGIKKGAVVRIPAH
jgi:alpha-acetolactate decarboxylase